MKSRLCIGLAAAIVVATAPGVQGETPVGGLICSNTTWDLAGSPYLVTLDAGGPIMVGCDATLTIDPGVEVRFESNLGLTVGHITFGGGTLVARGSPGSEILFTSNQPYEDPPVAAAPGDWTRIYFTDYALDADYTGGTYQSGSVLEYVIVEYAGDGGGAVTVEDCSPYLSYCEVRHNGDTGISVWLIGSPTPSLRIENCEVWDNSASGFDGYGGGIYLVGGSDHLLSGNNVHDCSAGRDGGGIYIGLNGRVTLDANTVTDNTASDFAGGGIYLSSTDESILSANRVTGNSAPWGGGIYVSSSGTSTLRGNTVTGNSANGDGCCSANGGGIVLGNSGTSTLTGNTITDNSANDDGGGNLSHGHR